MYNSFFGFREKPFKLVPNPGYLYLSRSHEEALAHLKYAVAQGEGFVEITGEVGTGKTLLCRTFLQNMAHGLETAYIFNPKLSAKGLLRAINSEFGIRSDLATIKELIDELNTFLIKKKAQGRRAVLIIDEAQNLGTDVLEQLRLLSNLETTKDKLLQMILVGQPELSRILASHELRQLAQRISLSCSIEPLTYEETRQYIIHRIHVASSKPRVEFTGRALRRIYKYSGGVPRLINIVCDRALLVAFSENIHRITGKVVNIAASELSVSNRGPGARQRPSALPLLVLASLAAAFIVITFYQLGWLNLSPVHSMVERIDAGENFGSVRSKQTVKIGFDKEISEIDTLIKGLGPDSLEKSVSRVLSSWQNNIDMPDLTHENEEAFISKAAESHGLEVYRVRGNLSLIATIGLPAVFSFQHPETEQRVFLAVLSADRKEIAFHDPRRGKTVQIPIESAGACWDGDAYVFWENPREITGVIGKDADAEAIAGLQMLLKAAGKSYVTINGTYDEKTRRAIKQIQAGQGLPVDGLGGAATKIVLYRLAASSQKPGSAGD
ncbi:MAG: AAA family ATPase [Desulfobacteraceae bacterium]|nr:AAA family ATPase [Desulfobacteraceae bacterium]